MPTKKYDPTKDNNPVKDYKPTVKIPFLDKLNVKKEESKKEEQKSTNAPQFAKKTGNLAKKTLLAKKTTTAKKSGGTLSYKDSYTDAVKAKWESKGGKEAYITAAKAWNVKKYGTTEPTAKAAKFAGGSKTKLATEHTASTTKVERIEPKPTTPIATETKSNDRLQQAIASANAPESLMAGTKTRREQRQANRQINRANKAANAPGKIAEKRATKTANKERRQDLRQEKGDKRFERRTGKSMSGTPSHTPSLDTGPGTYQGAQETKDLIKADASTNWRPKGKSILGSERP